MADRRTFRVCAEDDRFVSRAAALQLCALLVAGNAHRTHPESETVDWEAHRCREDRRITVLRRLNGECAQRGDDVTLWIAHATRRHEELMRPARPKDVVPSCAVEVDVNVAGDDQTFSSTGACGECGAVPCARNGDNLSNTCRINADDRVVNNLSID
jgi:hypothetical protein